MTTLLRSKIRDFWSSIQSEWAEITWYSKSDVMKEFKIVIVGIVIGILIIWLGDALGDFGLSKLLDFKQKG